METYLSDSKKLPEKIFNNGNNSCEAQIRAIDKELVALKAVVKCIAVYGLELEYPPGKLNARIEQLESLKANPKYLIQRDERKDSSSAPVAALPLPLPPSTINSQRSHHKHLAQFPPGLNQNRIAEKRHCDAAPTLAPESHFQLQHVTQHPRVEPPAEAALTSPRAPAAPLPLPLPPSTHNSQRSQQEHLPQFPLSLDQNRRPEKRRRDAAPALAPESHFQLQHVTKHPRVEPPAEATLTASHGTAYPVHSIHAPPQLLPRGQYIEPGRAHLMGPSGSHNFGDLNPAMPYMHQVGWQYRPNAAAGDGGNMHVGFPNNTFGLSSNMNLQPPYWRPPPGP